jgi:pimeloyl-ACP methyl ester carboxylesterase
MHPPGATDSDTSAEPRGTILVLHGIRDSKDRQVGFGRALAQAGYRAVLVDLRGHGASTGRWLTYGVVEARDLVQTLDALDSRGLLAGSVGVLGSSYGGAIGLQLAGIDSRVKAVVAIAPYAGVRDLIRPYARQMNMSWLVSDRAIADGYRQACASSGCDLDQADSARAVAASQARVLLIHGRDDASIPFAHSQRIAAAAPDRTRLMLLDGEDHISIFRDESGVLNTAALDWFARWTTVP